MKHKFKHIVKESKAVALSSSEKDEIKASLLRHVENHPLTSGSGSFIIPRHVSYFEWVGANLNNKKFAVPVVFSLLIILTTGISFASSISLPGNLLYPVKILNEKIDSLLASSPEEKIGVLTINAVNRLEEAEILYIEGQLDEKTEAKLAKSFSNNSELASISIAALENNNKQSNGDITLKFKGELSRHQKILNSFSAASGTESTGSSLSSKVDEVISKFKTISNENIQSSKIDDKKSTKKSQSIKNVNTIVNTKDSGATTTLNTYSISDIKDKTENKGDDKNLIETNIESESEASINIEIPEVKVNIGGSGGTSVQSLEL